MARRSPAFAALFAFTVLLHVSTAALWTQQQRPRTAAETPAKKGVMVGKGISKNNNNNNNNNNRANNSTNSSNDTNTSSNLTVSASALTSVAGKLLPPTTRSMRDLKMLLNALENNVPFGYAHFNDGEINAINCPEGGETDWGWQKCSTKLKEVMIRAMSHTAPNFLVGITCLCEFNMKAWVYTMHFLNVTHDLPYSVTDLPKLKPGTDPCPDIPPTLHQVHWLRRAFCHGHLRQYIFFTLDHASSTIRKFPNEVLKNRITVATIFINGNNEHARTEILRILRKATGEQGRNIHVVTGEGHDTNKLPFKVKSVIRTAKHHAFDRDYDTLRKPWFVEQSKFAPGDIVLIMAGPFGRILASEWTWLRPDVTFIDQGSFWDVELWGRKGAHACARDPQIATSQPHPSPHCFLKDYRLDKPKNCMYRSDMDYTSEPPPRSGTKFIERAQVLL
jgi:hypothetical protein